MAGAEPESPNLKTPGWLEELENKRKRPHKLAHDIGAGAPCLVCKEKCKGLNLHFWRKLCIECKCRKEDHEIKDDEDYAQFEILFGGKKVKRTTLKLNAQDKSFDWIPPNVPADLAVDYLKAIPQSKWPISDSEGARYRKQQLEKQVPLHDVDPNACHSLSENEMKEFEKYLNNLKHNVFGQGKILKYQLPKILQENFFSGNPSNIMRNSEEHENRILQSPIDPLLNVQIFKYSQPTISTETQIHPLKTLPLNKVKYRAGLKSGDAMFNLAKPGYCCYQGDTRSQDDERENTEKRTISEERDIGLKTPSSFISKNCSVGDTQNNNAHQDDNCNERTYSDLITGDGNGFEDSPCASREVMGKFLQLNVSSDEVPFVPVRECDSVQGTGRKVSGTAVIDDVSNVFPAPPSTCQQCLGILYPEEVVVQTDRAGHQALWHAKCFVCDTCKELLVDLIYFYHKGRVYCERHYSQMLKIPRCYACDELIFMKEYTCAEGKSFHVRHFCCFHCDQPLGGKQYIPKDSFPVCLACYQTKYGKDCRTCSFAIAAGEPRVSWKDLDFHATPECFRCTNCLKSLLGGKFVVKNVYIFCSKDCLQQFPD